LLRDVLAPRSAGHLNATSAFAARIFTLVTGFASAIVTARLILSSAGVENYALYSLLVALPALVPFTDLGAGAVLVNSYARTDRNDFDVLLRQQTMTVARIMTGFAIAVMLANVVLFAVDGWPALLGSAASSGKTSSVAFVCISVFCFSVPLGIWTKALLGLNRNHWIILVQGVQAPLVLVFVYVLVRTDDARLFPWISLAAFLSMLLVAVLGFAVAHRATDGQLGTDVVRALGRRAPGSRVMDVGLPMLVQTLTPPITNQATRFIVAQSVSVLAVAQYGVILQILTPALGLVSAVGLTLWPYYAKARQTGSAAVGPIRLSLSFAAVACLAALTWVALAPTLFDVMSADTIDIDRSLVACFSLQLITQAALYPLGMYLMSPRGIALQVLPAVTMCVSTLTLVHVLAPKIGIAAVPLSISLSTVVFQVLPFAYFILRRKDSV
jgi:O-antigen/teichoic acid export membrane protein